MAAPVWDQTAPNLANNWDDDVDQIRENFIWLMLAAAGQGYILPGWTTVVNGADKTEPDSIEMSKGSLGMKWTFTWSNSLLVGQVWQYDSGSGYATLAGGTLTLSYDGDDNFTGATAA